MLRTLALVAAVAVGAAAAMSCATDENRRIEAAQKAVCLEKDSPPDRPRYDGDCMRRVEEQVRAAASYRPRQEKRGKKK
ncbi:MAG: hypothetical protein JNJ73_18055 [Hyphomonadaceae bacterium]|nr:hypothetical protein [Hyphomonadaceae bacterium]